MSYLFLGFVSSFSFISILLKYDSDLGIICLNLFIEISVYFNQISNFLFFYCVCLNYFWLKSILFIYFKKQMLSCFLKKYLYKKKFILKLILLNLNKFILKSWLRIWPSITRITLFKFNKINFKINFFLYKYFFKKQDNICFLK